MPPKMRPVVDLSSLGSQENGQSFLPGTSISPDLRHQPGQDDAGFVVGEYRLTDIIPDIFQSRGGVLPRDILGSLLAGKINHLQALSIWADRLVEGTPQYARYEDLVHLKNSIQVNTLLHPIHIYKDNDRNAYVLQAGERRYWAFWLIQAETGSVDRIPAVVHAEPSRLLQITENEDVSPLSTVGRARQAALAYLDLLGLTPPDDLPTSDAEYWNYYRQALLGAEELTGKKNLPNNFWAKLESQLGMARVTILGQIELLHLPDDGLTLADEWYLNQNQIKTILEAPVDFQNQITQLAANYGIPAPEIKRIARLAQLPDTGAFWAAVDEIENKTIASNQSKFKRQARPPLEVHASKLLATYKSLQKISGGDCRSLAHFITLRRRDDALELAAQLEETAAAIRDEMNRG